MASGFADEVAVRSPDLPADGGGGGSKSESPKAAIPVPDKTPVRPIAEHADGRRPLILPPSIVEMRVSAHSAGRGDCAGITTTVGIVGLIVRTRTNCCLDGSKSHFSGGECVKF